MEIIILNNLRTFNYIICFEDLKNEENVQNTWLLEYEEMRDEEVCTSKVIVIEITIFAVYCMKFIWCICCYDKKLLIFQYFSSWISLCKPFNCWKSSTVDVIFHRKIWMYVICKLNNMFDLARKNMHYFTICYTFKCFWNTVLIIVCNVWHIELLTYQIIWKTSYFRQSPDHTIIFSRSVWRLKMPYVILMAIILF